ncbi:ATP-binding protein [Desulfobacterales bacterium HSG2]|nr:ATP-binding protein [Desulfobacterales bacterium HSG2]
MKLGSKMLIAFLFISLTPFISVCAIALVKSSNALSKQAFGHLESVREVKKGQIENFWKERFGNVLVLSKSTTIVTGLSRFAGAFRADEGKLGGALYLYAQLKYGNAMKRFVNQYEFDDLYLVDKEGDIVFSVAHKPDEGQNVRTGKLKNSPLGKCFQNSVEGVFFQDFKPYAICDNRCLAFLGAPVTDEFRNEFLGVVILRLTPVPINKIMLERSGMGETGETYLVGSDMLMRSDTFLDSVNHSVEASFINAEKGRIDTQASRDALSGKSGRKIITSYTGKEVLSAYSPVKVGDTKWALIAETESSEAFEAVNSLLITTGAMAIASVLIIFFVSFMLTRSIVHPITYLRDAMQQMRTGELGGHVHIKSRDEIGDLAESFNEMSEDLADSYRQIEIQNRELQRLDKLKDEFLANTSHELRTPLSGIIGIADSMLDGAVGPLAEAQRHNLSLIVSSGRRLTNLVNDILDFSKLRHHDLQLQVRPLDMRSVTDVVLMLSQTIVGNKNLRLVNQIEARLPAVRADEDRVQQILHNLVGNAVKFTDAGTVSVSAEVEDEYLSVTVSDTGTGVPEEKLDRIFESFEQANGSTAREYGGTGLGLAVTKNLVELHGGQIRAESEPGKGSHFTFTLPVSGDKAEPVRAADILARDTRVAGISAEHAEIGQIGEPDVADIPPERLCDGDLCRILAVDDEPVNLQVLKNQLASEHYSVTLAANGREAIAAIEDGEKFDLVLLDVMMPGMSGYEVCQRLRDTYSANELPVVMLTAKNQIDDLVAGFRSGANDYLTKPFIKEELLSRIETQLHLKALSEHLEQLVRKRTRQLEEAHAQIVKLEKQALETRMAGGFAHEMRNALVSAKIALKAVIPDGETLCEKNAGRLGELHDLIKEEIPDEKRDDTLDCFKEIDHNEEQVDRALGMINRSADRALHITTLILDYSKLGHAAAGDEEVRLRDVIGAVVEEHRDRFAEQNISARLDLSAKHALRGDTAHFHSMINNIVLNACDAFEEVGDDRERVLRMTLTEAEQTQIVTISDNATGIPEEEIRQIFEPFFSARPAAGTGLGLSFVMKLAEMYGGTIVADSEVGRGTTFTLTFPVIR